VRKLTISLLSLTLAVAGLYLLAGNSVYAAIQGSNVSMGPTGQLTETSAQGQNAEGGNVTLVNITAAVSTDKWQGFYGNVTGSLSLGYGSDSFYDFSGAVPLYLYATENATFDFSIITAVNNSEVDTAWGYTTDSDNDQARDVFTTGKDIAGIQVNATQLLGTGPWFSGLFSNGANADKESFAFGCNISNAGTAGFDGTDYHYQLMVPVDATTEVYYFFMEI